MIYLTVNTKGYNSVAKEFGIEKYSDFTQFLLNSDIVYELNTKRKLSK